MKAALPIVGMVFRPPALRILAGLPFEAPLRLQREPENPYDENAVKVLLSSWEGYEPLRDSLLAEAIPDHAELSRGQYYSSALDLPVHLGYVGAKTGHAAVVSEYLDNRGEPSIEGSLFALDNGSPAILIEVKDEGEDNPNSSL
jgi:hypothetical protein